MLGLEWLKLYVQLVINEHMKILNKVLNDKEDNVQEATKEALARLHT
jgi:hypothetical protein